MGKIGNFEYPEYKITDIMGVAEIIRTRFQGKVINQHAFCAELGHSNIRSGAYIGKVASLRRYGLISGRGELALTQLAEKILISKSEEERTEAIAQAMENVELFKKIFERLGEAIPSDNFWVDLVEITGEERSIAQNDALKIRALYLDGHKYLVSARKGESKEGITEAPMKESAISEDTLFELRTKDYGNLIVKDIESIGIAKNLIDVIEQKYKAVKGKKEKSPAS